MATRTASIKETGVEISQEEWARFDAAVAREKAERPPEAPHERGEAARDPAAERAGDQPRK